MAQSPAEFVAWRRADRYCLEEIARLADQEAFAVSSQKKAAAAEFSSEIVSVGDARKDGCIRPETTAEALAGLSPAFQLDGTVWDACIAVFTDLIRDLDPSLGRHFLCDEAHREEGQEVVRPSPARQAEARVSAPGATRGPTFDISICWKPNFSAGDEGWSR